MSYSYEIYGLTLCVLGVGVLAYRGVELQLKALKQLFRVHYYAGWLKTGLMMGGAAWVWLKGGALAYHIVQLDQWLFLLPGEVLLFRVTLEGSLMLVGAFMGALIANGLIQVLERLYHLLTMMFFRATGLNLKKNGINYQRHTTGVIIPSTVISDGFGGKKSPSQVAQRAIAKMEAEQKAARVAAEAEDKKSTAPKARALSTKAGR